MPLDPVAIKAALAKRSKHHARAIKHMEELDAEGATTLVPQDPEYYDAVEAIAAKYAKEERLSMRKIHEDVSAVYNLLVEAEKIPVIPDQNTPTHAGKDAAYLSGAETHDNPPEPDIRKEDAVEDIVPIEKKAVDRRHIKAVKIAR